MIYGIKRKGNKNEKKKQNYNYSDSENDEQPPELIEFLDSKEPWKVVCDVENKNSTLKTIGHYTEVYTVQNNNNTVVTNKCFMITENTKATVVIENADTT